MFGSAPQGHFLWSAAEYLRNIYYSTGDKNKVKAFFECSENRVTISLD
jgi:hypothetical protein